MTWMAGNLFVVDIEVARNVRELDVSSGSDDSFLSMPFDEAIRYFVDRNVIPPDQYYAKLGEFRSRSFTATRLATQSLRELAFKKLGDALRGEATYESFAATIRRREARLGIEPSSHGYLRTVFDTNVVSAYSAGRDEQLTHPSTVALLPIREYIAVMDGRVRRSHAALNGKQWDARQTDEWRNFQAPNGFNCRCTIVSRPARRGISASLSRTATHPSEIDGEDIGFNAAPRIMADEAT